MNPLIRKNRPGNQEPWTEEQVLAGLRLYFERNGHYPTAHEIDTFDYLPSSRSIQRSLGGLVQLRQKILPNEISDHTRGLYRSEKAREADKRAKAYEEEFYQFLLKNFYEISVHEHRVIRPGGIACDFFIYKTELDGVVIDLFYAQSVKTLANIVNIKLKRYVNLPFTVYFVLVGNESIDNQAIISSMNNRTIPLPNNIKVISEKAFKETVTPELKRDSQFAII